MSLNFQPITPFSLDIFKKYDVLRPIYMSEGHFLNQFIWENYYHTTFATDELGLYLLTNHQKEHGCFMPLCKEEDLLEVFHRMEQYFANELHEPMRMYLVDRPSLDFLQSAGVLENYRIEEDRDSFDYIYEADKLRTLSGRALHKKKNHLNSFLKTYEGHFQYETLHCSNINEIKLFHEKWLDERRIYDKYSCIDSEEEGIYRLFDHCCSIDSHMGGVRIDGELVAYTIGSYAPHIKTAFIHVEKADVKYTGLYNYINQQFLIHEFPEALYVNREDDLGQDNLRQAKLSYKPLRLEEKFNLYA